jgi:hypothetical protein
MYAEQETAEFSPEQLSAAKDFIASLPVGARVYVDEWMEPGWRFVYGDDREHALAGLNRVTPGARFRIRPGLLS